MSAVPHNIYFVELPVQKTPAIEVCPVANGPPCLKQSCFRTSHYVRSSAELFGLLHVSLSKQQQVEPIKN